MDNPNLNPIFKLHQIRGTRKIPPLSTQALAVIGQEHLETGTISNLICLPTFMLN